MISGRESTTVLRRWSAKQRAILWISCSTIWGDRKKSRKSPGVGDVGSRPGHRLGCPARRLAEVDRRTFSGVGGGTESPGGPERGGSGSFVSTFRRGFDGSTFYQRCLLSGSLVFEVHPWAGAAG